MAQKVFAPGKIILSGEYAVLFGESGIAIPSSQGITASFEANASREIAIKTDDSMEHPLWKKYIHDLIEHCQKIKQQGGTLTLSTTLPMGKGMGSSTAMIIAITSALLGRSEKNAREIENTMNPGNSGIDFAVIWNEKPILFTGGTIENIRFDGAALDGAALIDTGQPNETTPELVEWVKSRKEELKNAIREIGDCSRLLSKGASPLTIFPRHHRAQVELGVVPEVVQKLIEEIERTGGAAKVIGAGGRTGGAGMVLALKPPAS
jgi:mevalonate kinase